MRKWPLLFLLLLLPAAGVGQTNPSAVNTSINGRWEADAPNGPWTFDLTVTSDNRVVGRVMQHSGVPGPAEIYDGKLEGIVLTFKVKKPVISAATQEITFMGRIAGNEILFSRASLSVPNGADLQGPDIGVFGTVGPPVVPAKKTGPVPVPPVVWTADTTRPADVTGRWESLRWNLDQWVFNLASNGDQLTGTVNHVAGPGRQPLVQPQLLPISEGKIEGNLVRFKVYTDATRNIRFIGKVRGNELAMERVLELPPGAAAGFEAPYGALAPFSFLARRVPTAALEETAAMREVQLAEKKWALKPFTNYEFTVVWHCLCPMPTQPLTYTVSGNIGTAAVDARLAAMMGVPANALRNLLQRYASMDQFFAFLKEAAAKRPYELKMEYDATLGYPLAFTIRGGISVDDDIQMRITSFRPLP